ncbi:uncharacterized protein QC761_103075 [Podospora bellae-mahoneyi]|uniref:PSI domain-containing protein n=1 Tax=Podospora bellae-mahoneyi TaxID=2093777 RepID=A0ABR0FWY5_9PEZI|nr:hypothetical protein QC761_103075 [Podospora bellae-mahoneyi]
MSSLNPLETPDDHLRRCWRQQSCSPCLSENACSWCPFTQSCTPNTHPLPLLAPISQPDICPHWSERWEVRTQPLGCNMSAITALSILLSILSTILLGLLAWTTTVAYRRLRRAEWDWTRASIPFNQPQFWTKWHSTSGRSRWASSVAPSSSSSPEEQQPLLNSHWDNVYRG